MSLQKWDEMLRDGFMETGDVMEQRGPSTVVWIDRKKNIMKLSQVSLQSSNASIKWLAWHLNFTRPYLPCVMLHLPQVCCMGVIHPILRSDVLQGEFVSTGRLEAIYSGNSSLIHQMYIYGSSLRSYLLATVIPSPCKLHKAWSIADVLSVSRKPLLETAQSDA